MHLKNMNYLKCIQREGEVSKVDRNSQKNTFHEAKIEDIILELEKLSQLCEEKITKSEQLERQRFYEGMAIAYTTIALKLKGGFDYIEPSVIDHLYNAVKKTETNRPINTNHVEICSFCRRSKDEVGKLAIGPGVSICGECLKFGEEVINSH
jgi:hypothetical protein